MSGPAVRILDRVAELADWDQPTFQDNYVPAWNQSVGMFQGRPALPVTGTPGQYGDPSHYPVITTDAQGRVVNVVLQALPPVPAVPVSSVNGKAGDVVLNTGDIAEVVNLYFTDLRAAAAAPVQSVFGRAGNVSLQAGDIPAISSITQGGGTVSVAVDGALVLTPTVGKNATLSSGQLLLPAGTQAAPSLAIGQTNTGFFLVGSGAVQYVFNGAAGPRFNGATIDTFAEVSLLPSGTFNFNGDTRLYRDAANTLAQRNGVNPQTFRLYNTYTDASNGGWAQLEFSGNDARLTTNANGTGAFGEMRICGNGVRIMTGSSYSLLVAKWLFSNTGSFLALADNTYDIGASGTNRPRNLYLAGQALLSDGTIAAPSYAFASETNTGIYRPTTNTLGLSAGGSHVVWLSTAASLIKLRGDYGLAFCSGDASTTADTFLRRDAANTLVMRNGVNPQAFNIYGTYTDASNYERLTSDYDAAAGNFRLRSLAAGTGQVRGLYLDGAYALRLGSGGFVRWEINATGLVANNDNTYDIGASGANRPRNLYLGGIVNAAGLQFGITGVGGSAGTGIGLFSTQLTIGSNAQINFGSSTNYQIGSEFSLIRDAANTLAQRNGVNAQAFRVYNTFTDVSNGEWLDVGWSANICTIQPKNNGTGVARSLFLNGPGGLYLMYAGTTIAVFTNTNINLRTYLQPNTNNAFDLGDATHNFRNLYLGSQALLSDGTLAAPSYSFASEPGTGMRRGGTNNLSLTVNGSDVLNLSTASNFASMSNLTLIDTPATAYRLSPSQPNAVQVASGKQLGWSSTTSCNGVTDLALARDAANTLAQRNGVNAQGFRVYNTYTDVSNGEWFETGWAGNVCTLATKANGTGVVRNLSFPGKVLAGGVDLGASQLNVYSGVGSSPVLQCQLNNVTDGTTIFSVNNGGTSPFTVRGIYASLTSTSNAIFGIQQNGTGNAVMDVLMVGTVGDGFLRCGLNGGAAWSAGIKQSDGSFRIAPGASFATAAVLTLTTTTATFAVNVLAAGGTVLAPGLAFSSETGLGLYRPGAQTIGLVGAGSEFLRLDTSTVVIAANNLLAWGSNGIAGIDTVLRRDAANTLAQRNGVNPQTFRLYGTYTDTSNYELATFGYDPSNVRFQIAAKKAGTGINRPLALISDANVYIITSGGVGWFCTNSGHWLNTLDNLSDIGASGANRPRNLYLGTGLNTPTAILDTITPRTANVTLSSGQLLLPDGSAALPSVALGSAPTLGWAKIVSNRWSFIQLGSEKIQLGGNLFLGSDVGLAWMPTAEPGGSTADVVLQRDAPSILAQRSGVSPQSLRIYNTYTDANNYERGIINWAGNLLQIGSEHAGTGAARNVTIGCNPSGSGDAILSLVGNNIRFYVGAGLTWQITSAFNLVAGTDNAYDIGASGASRPRNLYLAGAVATKVKAGTPTDADFTNPVDGMIAADSTANKIWVRIGGVWKGVGVA